MPEQPVEAKGDGRTARALRTRTAVVEALLDLIAKGEMRPPAHRIATRAGVSLRSVFQHFADLDSLMVEAGVRHLERVADIFWEVPASGPLEDRLDAFVSQRARWFEAVTPVRRAAALQEPFSDQIAQMVDTSRVMARRDVERVFGTELDARAPGDRVELLEALDSASCWSTWDALRRYSALDANRAAAVMKRTVVSLLRDGSND
jgi:TetR/AcrR family transcriptional regulator of autoinduction and epiphytic fitness